MTLMVHCGAERVTREALALLPDPKVLGPHHKPIRHDALVGAIHEIADAYGLPIAREEYALHRDGHLMFGVLDFARNPATLGLNDEGAMSLGLRASTDCSFAITGVAGSRILVCDNLALSGDLVAFYRRSTLGLRLADVIQRGFDRFLEHAGRLMRGLERLRETPVSDDEARSLIYRTMADRIIPVRLFHDVDRNYFDVDPQARPECTDRSLWGLHNAFTRAFKALGAGPAWRAGVALGKLFGLRTGQKQEGGETE